MFAGWLGLGMIDAEGHFWAGCDLLRRGQPRAARHARGAAAGEAGAVRSRWPSGSGLSYVCLHDAARPGRRGSRPWPGRSTRFFYNKWYFDELYDFLFVRPAKAIGYGLWRGGDVGHHRPLRPGRRRATTLDTAKRRVRLQTGYVYHYAFVMLIGVAALVSWYLYLTARVSDMGDWPLLSLVTFLPLVGVAFIADPARRARGRRPQQPQRRACGPRLLTFLLSLAVWSNFDPAQAGLPAGREEPLAARPRRQLLPGRRRHLAVVRPALGAAHRGRGDRLLALGARPGQGVHDRLPGHGHADDRRVLRARRRPVLPVLRGDPDPDVPDHRHLGRAAADLRRLQVLPLHAAGLGAVPGRHPGDLPAHRHDRDPRDDRAARGRRARARRCRSCSGSRCSPRSRSRCRCGRSTPGCPTRTSRRRPRARCCWPACS